MLVSAVISVVRRSSSLISRLRMPTALALDATISTNVVPVKSTSKGAASSENGFFGKGFDLEKTTDWATALAITVSSCCTHG